MKKIIAMLLVCSLILTSCAQSQGSGNSFASVEQNAEMDTQAQNEIASQITEIPLFDEEFPDPTPYHYEVNFESLNDEDLMRYIEDDLYLRLVAELDSDEYFVEDIRTVYISQEYIDELAYNSQPNIYFGYTLEELDAAFEGTRYVFTLGNEGDTVVAEFEEYDDIYERIIKNVAVGTGVILICVTVSVVSAGLGVPAVSMVFAVAAETGTALALSGGSISAIAAGITTGIQTHDMSETLRAAALAGSEGFKWGAITGSISGGTSEFFALNSATQAGLTMNEAAIIQRESRLPLDVIAQFHKMEEYEIFRSANLKPVMINGRTALVRADIDLYQLDEYGRTNLQRMRLGYSALDLSGKPFELHHIGQEIDGTLAILTQAEHDSAVLHGYKITSEINRAEFARQRRNFWKTMANLLEIGGI